jgi:hypothetical protein
VRINPRARTVRSVHRTYIDVIHYRKADTNRLRERDVEDDDEGSVIIIILICNA